MQPDPDDAPERDALLFGESIEWNRESNDAVRGGTVRFGMGGIRSHDPISARLLADLVEGGHADPPDRQNHAPRIGEFLAFAAALGHLEIDRVPEPYEGSYAELDIGEDDDRITLVFEGYAVSPDRRDYRVSIEGYRCGGLSAEQALQIAEQHGGAESFERYETDGVHEIRAWWD